MKVKTFLTLIFCLCSLVLISQQIFLLERPGTIKNHKYFVGDKIKIQAHDPDTVIKGRITSMQDSSIIINYATEIFISRIDYVIRTRYGFNLLQRIFLTAGFSYVLIATFNGLINNDSPVIDQQTLIISGSIIAAGILLTPLTSRKHKTDNKKWRVKVLDFDN
jgi:hypothetical protein